MNGKTRHPVPGDVVWVDFDPAAGHEQAGLRPALVVSSAAYNELSSYVIVCPITSSTKPWPWKVPLPPLGAFRGFVAADQVKSIDRRTRVRRIAGNVPDSVIDETRVHIATLLGIGA